MKTPPTSSLPPCLGWARFGLSACSEQSATPVGEHHNPINAFRWENESPPGRRNFSRLGTTGRSALRKRLHNLSNGRLSANRFFAAGEWSRRWEVFRRGVQRTAEGLGP